MNGKRILLCCNRTLSIGGIEKALTTFLRALDTKNNEVLLVLHDQNGALHQDLPLEDMEVFYTNTISPSQILKDDLKSLRIHRVIQGLWYRIRLRLESDWYARIMHTYKIIQRQLIFPGHFDCAISFTTDYSDLAMICSVDADKRICFVHGDATRGKRAARLNDQLVRQLDKIYAVSEQAKDLFLQVHPRCQGAVDVLHNVIIPEDILAKAQAPAEGMTLDGTTTLCTVGRLSPEKGQQMIPEAIRILHSRGYDLRWYLVGDGPLRPQLEEAIRTNGLQQSVFLLGAKTNPYPYIDACHIYVQTSLSEAYCLTVAEARILCKPIITTDAPGLREQIIHGKNGLLLDAMTPEALADGICALLDDPQLRKSFTAELEKANQIPAHPLQKLYDFITS